MSNFNESAHKLQVHDMQVNSDQSFIITASKDKTAKLFNARTLDCLKAYRYALHSYARSLARYNLCDGTQFQLFPSANDRGIQLQRKKTQYNGVGPSLAFLSLICL